MPDLFSSSLIVNSILFILGLWILTKSSDIFVDSAAFIAKKLHVSDLVIGLTLVSIGTSLPELATNIYSSINGNDGIAVGNAVGSNITNIMLGLALSMILLKKIPISKSFFFRDALTMSGIFVLFALFCYFGDGADGTAYFTRIEAIIMIVLGIAYLVVLTKSDKKDEIEEAEHELEAADHSGLLAVNNLTKAIIFLIVSTAMILFGAKLSIDNVIWAARKFEIADSIIAATVVAIGTSLPEIAVSISGIKKAKPGIAVGNIIGSCIFNLVMVMGISGTIKPLSLDTETLSFILPSMMISGGLCVLFMLTGKWTLRRWEGILLILGYTAFIIMNVVKG